MTDQTPPPTPASLHRGYPGRAALDVAESRLRAQLAKLARDPDTIEQASTLAEHAAAALTEITTAAYKAEEDSPRSRARARRQRQRITGLFERAGRPLPDSFKAPEPHRDGG